MSEESGFVSILAFKITSLWSNSVSLENKMYSGFFYIDQDKVKNHIYIKIELK